VLYVIECGIDFKLGVLLGEAPLIGKAHIGDRRKRCYRGMNRYWLNGSIRSGD